MLEKHAYAEYYYYSSITMQVKYSISIEVVHKFLSLHAYGSEYSP